MARLTGSDLVTYVRPIVGGPPDESVTDTMLLRFINLAYRKACQEARHPRLLTEYTITTASGTAQYENSSSSAGNFEVIDMVDETNHNPLQAITQEHYNMFIQGNATDVTGHPTYYLITGTGTTYEQTTFYPTPDGTYTIRVFAYQYPTELTNATTSTSVLPEAFDEYILWRAAEIASVVTGNPERMQLCQQQAQQALQSAARVTRQTPTRGPQLRGFTINGPRG